MENITEEVEIIKKNQMGVLWWKNAKTKIKISIETLKSRLELAEERVSKL